MTVPATLNGYPVIHSASYGDEALVLCYRHGHEVHPFVIALWAEWLGDSWNSGDYRATLPDAMFSFNYRARFMGGMEKEI